MRLLTGAKPAKQLPWRGRFTGADLERGVLHPCIDGHGNIDLETGLHPFEGICAQRDKNETLTSQHLWRLGYFLTHRTPSIGSRSGMRVLYLITALLLVMLTAVACDTSAPPPSSPEYGAGPTDNAKPHYHLAIHPLHNPKKLAEAYHPLIEYLNAEIPEAGFVLEASRDYQAYERKFRARTPEFLLPNPWQTLEAIKKGYKVIAMAGDANDFKGIFIVRKDSGIQSPSELKGRVVSYPSHTALAACIMPQYFLYQQGLDINQEITNVYVGSQESSIMNAYLGKSAAGATWPPPWRLFQKDHPAEAAQLKLIWETPPLMNNSIMVRDDIPAALRDRVQALLLGLDETPDGRDILNAMETARFHAADDASYNKVRDYVAVFEEKVRPVEQK
ncbi:MAG: phosphate/phosphite/phosphonate ABC transporter substrate-binding protein [Candidatus Thiodiazotropha sp. 6PLUC1]